MNMLRFENLYLEFFLSGILIACAQYGCGYKEQRLHQVTQCETQCRKKHDFVCKHFYSKFFKNLPHIVHNHF